MTKIDKFGAVEGTPIVECMHEDDYFVRMVFPLPLTSSRLAIFDELLEGKIPVGEALEAAFFGNTTHEEAYAEVHDATHVLPLEPLPHDIDDLPVINMIVCAALAKKDFIKEYSNEDVPETPAAALARLQSQPADLMTTAFGLGLLDSPHNNVSLVFEVDGNFFKSEEAGFVDVFYSYVVTQANAKGVQAVLELDNSIG